MKKFLVVLIAVICLTLFSGTILSYAKEKSAPEITYYKYYTSIQIEAGDSLWNIASRYVCEDVISMNDYIREIQSINSLKGDAIQAGDTLTIIYYSPEYK